MRRRGELGGAIAGRKDTLALRLRVRVFRILFGMVAAPLPPERRRNRLDEAGDRRGEERAPQAEDFGKGQQEEERDERMDAYRMSQQARREDVALDHAGDDDQNQREHRCLPSLRKRDEDADRADKPQPDHRDELEEEGEYRQHWPERHANDRHEDGDHHRDGEAEQQLTTDVTTHDAVEALDEEGD